MTRGREKRQAGNPLKRFYARRFESWLQKRLPVVEQIQLSHRQLYIFPSSAGLFFLILITLLWLMATNYENNLVFMLCFFLAALFVVVIHFSHANLSGITIRPVRASSVFAGEQAVIELCLSHSSSKFRDSIELYFTGGEPVELVMNAPGDHFVTLLVPTNRRGLLKPGRLHIRSFAPLGLLRVWSYVNFSIDAVVYPAPVQTDNRSAGKDANTASHYIGTTGSDDYAGLKQYQPGDSLRHVAWKKYAQEQGLWSKQYADPVGEKLWVDWDSFHGLHKEHRLSCMTWLVCHYSDRNLEFGMHLPASTTQPASGLNHRNRLLRQLALFELDDEDAVEPTKPVREKSIAY